MNKKNLLFIIFACLTFSHAGAQIIQTIAGTGVAGTTGDGGLATLAEINDPYATAADAAGNVYIADYGANRVRMINAAGIISTFAGTGTGSSSGDGGPATSATLNGPIGVAVDASGNVYISEYLGGRVRKVNSSGTISTFATGVSNPTGLCTDAAGNLYIADQGDHLVRKVTPGGTMTTVAGDGSTGYTGDGGPALSASLNDVTGVAVDPTGNIYIAMWNDEHLRMVNTSGIINTVAGTGTAGYSGDGGPALTAELNQPYGCATDAAGNVYIADVSNNRIRKITVATGIITTIAGDGSVAWSGDGGPATSAGLGPDHVFADQYGYIYISDYQNKRIRKVNPSTITGSDTVCVGATTMLTDTSDGSAGSWSSSNTAIASVNGSGTVTGIATGTATISYSYVATGSATITATQNIQVLTTPTVTAITGAGFACLGATTLYTDGTTGGTWSSSNAAAGTIDGTGLFTPIAPGSTVITYSVTNSCGNATATEATSVEPVISTGIITTIAGTGTGGYTGDGGPATSAEINDNSVAVDQYGNIYIAEFSNNRVRMVNPSGVITTIAGNGSASSSGDGGPATSAGVSGPAGVVVDPAGNIYIAEQQGHAVRMVNTSGIISTVAGDGAYGYTGDGGPATSAELSAPSCVALDASGNLYIADFNAHVVRLVNTSGIISTFAGNGTSGSSGDGGPATSAEMLFPYWVYVDNQSNVLITDVQSNCIRKVNTSGTISTIAGTGTAAFSGDGGLATAAQLDNPGGSCTDAYGNIYFADQFNNRIRRIDTFGIITTIAGTGITGFSGDGGMATSAELYNPDDVVCDNAGNLYESEAGRIRKITTIANVITGADSVCAGAAITLTDTAYGGAGTWSTSDISIASVSTTGVVTGVTSGTVTVFYTVGNSCGSAYTTKHFKVNPLPVAGTITGPANICAATTATVTETATTGTWSSSNTGIASINAAGVVHAVAQGIDTIIYTVTNSCGTAQAILPMAVITVPAAGNIIGTDSICIGSSATLTDTGATVTGTWSSTNLAIASISSGGTVTTTTNDGTDIIIYTVTNSCGSAYAVYTLTVSGSAASVSVAASTSYTVCAGTAVTYTAIAVNGGTAPAYQWQVNGINEGTAPTYTLTPADGDAVTCILTSNASCALPATATSTAINMTVNPILTPSVSVSASTGSTACSGTLVTYSATIANGGASPALEWQKNGVDVSAAASYTYAPADGDIITCVLTSDYACLSSSTALSNSITMSITSSVVPLVSIAEDITGSICAGTHVTYTATPVNGGGSPTYQWQVNGINTGTSSSYNYEPAAGDHVTCILTSSAPCATPASVESAPIIMEVNAAITPEVSVSASPAAEVCSSTAVTYSATGSGGGSSPVYEWFVNGTSVGFGSTYTYTPVNGDIIACEITSDAACALSTTALSPALTMTVSPYIIPEIVIGATPSLSVTAPGDTITFHAVIVTGGGAAPGYQWYVNGTAVPGATSSTFSIDSFSSNDAVYCTLTSDDPCAGITTVNSNTQIVKVSLGIPQVAMNGDIQLLPNPNNGSFAVKGTMGNASGEAILEVTDMLGQVVYHATTTIQQGEINANLTLSSNLAAGMYLLNIRSGEATTVLHFVLDK